MLHNYYKAMKKNNKLAKIKEELPHGAIGEIAKRSGVVYTTVSRVLYGKSTNPKVIKAIGDYLKEINESRLSLDGVVNQYLSPVL